MVSSWFVFLIDHINYVFSYLHWGKHKPDPVKVCLWLEKTEAVVCTHSTERKTVVRPLPRGNYSSQNMNSTCQPSVTKPFSSRITFSYFWETLFTQVALYSAHMPLCRFGSPKDQALPLSWCSEATGNAHSTLAPALWRVLQSAPTSKWSKFICYLKLSATPCQAQD